MLRQFTRAVTTDHILGDELCRAIINHIGGRFTEKIDRALAFKNFLNCWNDITRSAKRPALFTDDSLIYGFGPPPETNHLLLMLKDIVELEEREICDILDLPLDELRQRLEAIRGAMYVAGVKKVLIIEDQPIVTRDLQENLNSIGDIRVRSASTAQSAADIAAEMRPDLILADYMLEEESTGMDAVTEIRHHLDCPVIFITAYPEAVLKGGEFEPDFVIAKPFTRHAIRAASWQCLSTPKSDVEHEVSNVISFRPMI
ncbi:response regulator [Hyphococcus sp.]|uniref:response regulator n=1 Tax=Hyphococcus sp. TaxID=2038636 RepID=UPI003CCB8A9E